MSLESRLAPLSLPKKVVAIAGLSVTSIVVGYVVGSILMVAIGYAAYKNS